MSEPSFGELLSIAPNLFGEIARLINSCLDTDQPATALSASLAFMGALKSGRVSHESRITPCAFVAIVAGSGTGKSQAKKLITKICKEAGISSENFLMGQPASDSALLKKLGRDRCNRQFLIWDEFGLALEEMITSTNGYRRNILSVSMDLFSSSGEHYIGKEYADERRNRIDIASPFFSMWGISTPSQFFGALSKSFIENGFLPRWLIFQGVENYDFKDPAPMEIPLSVIGSVREVERGLPVSGGGDITRAIGVKPKPIVFEHPMILTLVKDEQNALIKAAKSEIERIFWRRYWEHFVKVCMALSDDNGVVSWTAAGFAWKLTKKLLSELVGACSVEVHDSQYDKAHAKKHKSFIDLIAPGESIPKWELTKRASNKNYRKAERQEWTEEMLESGLWTFQKIFNEETRRSSEVFSRPK